MIDKKMEAKNARQNISASNPQYWKPIANIWQEEQKKLVYDRSFGFGRFFFSASADASASASVRQNHASAEAPSLKISDKFWFFSQFFFKLCK